MRASSTSAKARLFWPLVLVLFAADCSTKELVETSIAASNSPYPVLGDYMRFSVAYNPAAALNVSFGPHSREILSVIAVVALLVLWRLYQTTPHDARLRAAALGCLVGGALGNLIERLRSPRGVTDFIDVGVGAWRFWTFNVADLGITVGAALLALAIWREDARRRGVPDPVRGTVGRA